MRAKIQGKEGVEEYYQNKEVAEKYMRQRYSSLFGKLRNALEIKAINSFLKELSPENTLDMAVGTGRVTKQLRNYGRGYAFDSSEEMLAEAKKNIKDWVFKVGDAFNLPFEDNFFDIILSTRFIWHFEEQDREKLFQEIHGKLKDNGYLIFDFPNIRVKRFVPYKAIIGKQRVYTQSWDKEGIKKELRENGFSVVSIKSILNNPVALHNISDRFQSILGWIIMKIINALSKKEPYNYLVLARKVK